MKTIFDICTPAHQCYRRYTLYEDGVLNYEKTNILPGEIRISSPDSLQETFNSLSISHILSRINSFVYTYNISQRLYLTLVPGGKFKLIHNSSDDGYTHIIHNQTKTRYVWGSEDSNREYVGISRDPLKGPGSITFTNEGNIDSCCFYVPLEGNRSIQIFLGDDSNRLIATKELERCIIDAEYYIGVLLMVKKWQNLIK